MPNYSVHCSNPDCEYRGEHLSKTTGIGNVACPSCNEGRLEKDVVQSFHIGGKSPGNCKKIKVVSSWPILCSCHDMVVGVLLEVGINRGQDPSRICLNN